MKVVATAKKHTLKVYGHAIVITAKKHTLRVHGHVIVATAKKHAESVRSCHKIFSACSWG